MMITLQDLIDRFGEDELANLSDRENYRVIDEVVINKAIKDAETTASSYLLAAGLFAIANDQLVYVAGNTPAALTNALCDIARYELHVRGVTETVQKRYDDAIAWLKLVMKHPAMLTGKDTKSSSHAATSGVAVMPNPVPSIYGD